MEKNQQEEIQQLPFDLLAKNNLSNLQEKHLEQIVDQMNEEDLSYMEMHPEINQIVEAFLIKLYEEQPNDVSSFAGDFFCQEKLEQKIKEILKQNLIFKTWTFVNATPQFPKEFLIEKNYQGNLHLFVLFFYAFYYGNFPAEKQCLKTCLFYFPWFPF